MHFIKLFAPVNLILPGARSGRLGPHFPVRAARYASEQMRDRRNGGAMLIAAIVAVLVLMVPIAYVAFRRYSVDGGAKAFMLSRA